MAVTLSALALAVSPAQAAADDEYAEAMRLLAQNRPAEAAQVLARVVAAAPEHAGALLDLAIVQCALGHAQAAMDLLDVLGARFVPPPGIAAAMAELRARGCAPAPPGAATWTLGLSRGFDSNANQGASVGTLKLSGSGGLPVELPLSPEYLPRADRFTQLNAEFSQALPWGRAAGLRGFAQLQGRWHDALGQYDTVALLVGAGSPWRLGGWEGQAAAALGAMRLGGQIYQRQARARLQAAPPLGLPAGWRLAATAEAARTQYPSLDNFDSTTRELGGLLEWRGGRRVLQASLAAAADHAAAGRPGGDRKGWQAALQAGLPIAGTSFAELTAMRRVWRGTTVYAPGLIDTVRDQTTDTLGARLTRPLGKEHALFAELRLVRNRESIPVFGHAGTQLTIGWEWRGLGGK